MLVTLLSKSYKNDDMCQKENIRHHKTLIDWYLYCLCVTMRTFSVFSALKSK